MCDVRVSIFSTAYPRIHPGCSFKMAGYSAVKPRRYCKGDGWITCHCKEEANEEDGDEDRKRRMEDAQQEAGMRLVSVFRCCCCERKGDEDRICRTEDTLTSKGMLLVSEQGWKCKLKEKLREACTDENTLKEEEFEKLFESVEKAGKATCLIHRKGVKGGDSRGGGKGTGLLISPKSPHGWLVITNNHVTKDDEEAELAEVKFDFEVDGSEEGTKTFKVDRVVSKDFRTVDA